MKTPSTSHNGFKVGDKVENFYDEVLEIVEFDENSHGEAVAVLSDNSVEDLSELVKA